MRTKTYTLRLQPVERTVLEILARRERRKPSELVRELIRRAAETEGVWPSVTDEEPGGDENGRQVN